MDKYILDSEGNPVKVTDVLEWARWKEENRGKNWPHGRILSHTFIGEVMVSTVFLSINHNFFGQGDPILWETMIFWNGVVDHEEYQQRYRSRLSAVAGHDQAVAYARDVLRAAGIQQCP